MFYSVHQLSLLLILKKKKCPPRMEYFEVEKIIQVKTYSYHYQDLSGQMVHRYDNAQHYPQSKTFPNHKHLTSDTIESDQPDIAQVMNEIQSIIINKRK